MLQDVTMPLSQEFTVGCVVVLYKPDASIIERWRELADENKDVVFIFVDNTPACDAVPEIHKAAASLTHHIFLNKNMGIATAQNIGIKFLKDYGCSYIVFFDQDSHPTADLIRNLVKSFIRESSTRHIGALGPKVLNSAAIDLKETTGIEVTDKIISSGLTTSMQVIDNVGNMEDDLFIDIVDHEWCWRAGRAGYTILIDNNLQLPHRIGKANVKCFGKQIHLTAPTRYFYSFRNSRRMFFRRYVPLKWKLHTIKMMIRTIILVPVCKDFKGQKRATISNAIRGLFSKSRFPNI